MNFRIGGNWYEISREDIIAATRNVAPDIPDARYKYFVRLHERRYPIKQVIRLATGLGSQDFISQDAHRILTRLRFDIVDISEPIPAAAASGEVPSSEETLRMLVVFETGEDGWEVASCPTLPGCRSQGRTRNEARANIREAIRGYVASMREHGVPPPAAPSFEVIDVPL